MQDHRNFNLPKISIIILNYNGINDTCYCLSSVRKTNYANFEIIVVDNGSSNNEAEIIKQKFPEIKLIKNKINLIFAEGNNSTKQRILKKNIIINITK